MKTSSKHLCWFLYLLCINCLSSSINAYAQAQPTIYIILHEKVTDTAFLEDLECMLKNTFTTPFEVITQDRMDYNAAYDRPERQQYRISTIQDQIHVRRANGSIPNSLVFYVIADDMYDWIPQWNRNANFLFAQYHRQTHIALISMARVGVGKQNTVVDRLYRMIAKDIALAFGHEPSGECFMAFSQSIGALDGRRPRICEPDLSQLKKRGLIFPDLKEDSALRTCNLIS